MSNEQARKMELDRHLVAAYADTFIPRFDLYPMQMPTGRYICVKKRLDIELVALHLQGAPTLGAYALDQNDQAKWICVDADDDIQWQGVLKLAESLMARRVQPYLEPSRRGGHLWLFTPLLQGKDARRLGKALVSEFGLEGIELYPKQDRLVTGPGSFVRLPLGKHRKTGRRYHFVTLEGKPLAPTVREQVELLASPRRVPQEFIDQVLAIAPPAHEVSPTPAFSPAGDVPGETLSERLKNRISVFEFVSAYVPLDEDGTGHCPFHDDHHKSFGVNQDGNYWHCWAGCGGGSIVDFWMKWRQKQGEDDSFKDSIADLARMLL